MSQESDANGSNGPVNASDFLAIMRMLIQQETRDNNQSSQTPPGNTQDLLKSFLSTKPDSFLGSSNPDDAYTWLQHVRKKLDAMKCPEGDKVRLATHMLSGRADSWWSLQKTGYEEEHPNEPIPWKWFEEEFFKHYFPYNLRRARKQEFENLKQGDMSVQEYSEEWHRLSTFGGSSVVELEERVARFIDGLNPYLATIVRPHRLKTVAEVMDVAIGVERDRHQSFELRKKKKLEQYGAKRYRETELQDSVQKIRYHGPSLPLCSYCRKPHSGECFRKNLECYKCHKIGHKAHECKDNKTESKKDDRK